LGREECPLFSHVLQPDVGHVSRPPGHGRPTVSLRAAARVQSWDDIVALDEVGEQVVVLRKVIEAFGGEVVSSTLVRHLGPLAKSTEARTDHWMRKILGELELCGALALEDLNGIDVIVRIQPAGVTLAYGQPALAGHRGEA
jgi:hypothetical protein